MMVLTYVGSAADGGESGADATWRLVAWANEVEGMLGTPVLPDGPSGTFLTFSRNGGGSAAASRDVVARGVNPTKWREIDASTWKAEFARRLPRPLTSMDAFSLDLVNLSAEIPLARPEDPCCCPTGGTANVKLALKGDVLVVDGMTLRPHPRPAKPAAPPARQPATPRQ
jgi:hypothetical protein